VEEQARNLAAIRGRAQVLRDVQDCLGPAGWVAQGEQIRELKLAKKVLSSLTFFCLFQFFCVLFQVLKKGVKAMMGELSETQRQTAAFTGEKVRLLQNAEHIKI
jgi:hypothetical protein